MGGRRYIAVYTKDLDAQESNTEGKIEVGNRERNGQDCTKNNRGELVREERRGEENRLEE